MTISKDNKCPECHSSLTETTNIKIRSKRYNEIEDSIVVEYNITEELTEVRKNIDAYENKYLKLSRELKEYKRSIGLAREEIESYSKFMGLNEINNSLNIDLLRDYDNKEKLEEKKKKIEKSLRKVDSKKRETNEKYRNLISLYVNNFGLNELQESQYKNINSKFCGSGSNKPISTLIWYITLNEMKKDISQNFLGLPMVLDSPKNAEMDDNKERSLIDFILKKSSVFKQMIFSSIGFDKEEFEHSNNINVIELKNNKYNLLNKYTYLENKNVLEKIMNQRLL